MNFSAETGTTNISLFGDVLLSEEITFSQALRQAMKWHSEGRLGVAKAAYGRILRQAPDHPDALHYYGVALHQLGNSDAAVEAIRRANELAPEYVAALNNLGNVFKEMGINEEAEQAYRRVIEVDPRNADAFNNLGVVLKTQGKLDDACHAYQMAIDLDPDHPDAWHNLGNALWNLNHINDALSAFRRSITLRPYNAEVYRNLGYLLYSEGRSSEAAVIYREWLLIDPGNPQALHMLAACSGENVPARASDGYIINVFDNFAATFDEVLHRLDYHAPMLVSEAVRKVLGGPVGMLEVLDAGCGTGICAPLLRPFAKWLTGVDLSKRMLEKAAERNSYDELFPLEIVSFLSARERQFDLIVSSDTLCYFGDLRQFMAAAAKSLRHRGHLVFTVEAATVNQSKGYQIQPHGRFSHHEEYVRDVIHDAGLKVISISKDILRNEGSKPVQGYIVAARLS